MLHDHSADAVLAAAVHAVAEVVAHRAMRTSNARKLPSRPLSENGTIGFPVENYPRNKSVRLYYLHFRHLPYMVT